MKDFYEFDPIHPFYFSESVQIRNGRAFLSHIPLVDSVSINGFNQADTPSDVDQNSFWCDYRFEDGYRSANGEILFHSSNNERFIDVSYLGIGTVLRAKDMNEVADSLDSIRDRQDSLDSEQFNQNIRIGVVANDADRKLQDHIQDSNAHSTLILSLTSSREEVDYQLNALNSKVTGIESRIDDGFDFLKNAFHETCIKCEEALDGLGSNYQNFESKGSEFVASVRDEFTGVYNRISAISDKFDEQFDSVVADVDFLLATERHSFTTMVDNARDQAIQRAFNDASNLDEVLRADFQSQLQWESDRRDDLQDQISTIETSLESVADQFPSIEQRLISEQSSRIQQDNSLRDYIVSLNSSTSSSIDSIQSKIGNLADTLYQARQATNNQIESLRANIAIAEEKMLIAADKLESLTNDNKILKSDFQNGLNQINEMRDDMNSYIDSQFEPFRQEFIEKIADSVNAINSHFDSVADSIAAIDSDIDDLNSDMEGYYSSISESISAVWDEFSDVADSINANAVGIDAVSTKAANIQTSLGNANTSIGTVNTRCTNIQTSLGNTNTSIGTVNTRCTNIQTSLGNVTTRVTNLEAKHNPLVITTNSSTTNGAIWYV